MMTCLVETAHEALSTYHGSHHHYVDAYCWSRPQQMGHPRRSDQELGRVGPASSSAACAISHMYIVPKLSNTLLTTLLTHYLVTDCQTV